MDRAGLLRVHAHDRRPGPRDARLPAADHRRGRRRLRRRGRDHGDGQRHPLRPAGLRRPPSCSPASACRARTWAPARSCRGSSAMAGPPSCCLPAATMTQRRRPRLGLLQPRRRGCARRGAMRSRDELAKRAELRALHHQEAARRRMERDDRAGARNGSARRRRAAWRPTISAAPTRLSRPSRSRSSRVIDRCSSSRGAGIQSRTARRSRSRGVTPAWRPPSSPGRSSSRATASWPMRSSAGATMIRRPIRDDLDSDCRRAGRASSATAGFLKLVRRRWRQPARRPQPRHRPRDARLSSGARRFRLRHAGPRLGRDLACSERSSRSANGFPKSPAAKRSPPSR